MHYGRFTASDGKVLDLVLLRHGPTPWNEQKRFQGWGDPGLSAAGRDRAGRLAERLAAERFDRVWTSDLRRARETARIVFPGVEVVQDGRLRELHFGKLEGRTYEECLDTFGDPFRAWVEDPAVHDPPGGESLDGFQARIRSWMDDLPPAGAVAVMAHSGSLHILLAEALRVPYPTAARLRLSGCGITRLRRWPDHRWTVDCVNETAHLS